MSEIIDEADKDKNKPMLIDQSLLDFVESSGTVLLEITNCLSSFLGFDVQEEHGLVPAALIFNPLASDCAIWIDHGKAYGKARTKSAIEKLSEAKGWLESSNVEDLSEQQVTIVETRLRDHSGPLFHLVSDSMHSYNRVRILDSIDLLLDHLTECLRAEKGRGGNYRAFRTAVALRAIFETYGDLKVTAGDTADGRPSGKFCACLERIFTLTSLSAGFRHYADKAKKLPSDAPLLKSMRQELIDVPMRIAASSF